MQSRQDFGAMIQFGLAAKLRQIAAEHDKIRLGRQQIGFRDGANQAAIPVSDETIVFNMLDMGVGNVGEGEVLAAFRKGQFDQTDGQGAANGSSACGFINYGDCC
jgi:hypothetical protein